MEDGRIATRVIALTPSMKIHFDLRSVHAEVLPWTVCLTTLVLIAQAVFLLERGQTARQSD